MREAERARERGDLELVRGVGVRVAEDDRERAEAVVVELLELLLDCLEVYGECKERST